MLKWPDRHFVVFVWLRGGGFGISVEKDAESDVSRVTLNLKRQKCFFLRSAGGIWSVQTEPCNQWGRSGECCEARGDKLILVITAVETQKERLVAQVIASCLIADGFLFTLPHAVCETDNLSFWQGLRDMGSHEPTRHEVPQSWASATFTNADLNSNVAVSVRIEIILGTRRNKSRQNN